MGARRAKKEGIRRGEEISTLAPKKSRTKASNEERKVQKGGPHDFLGDEDYVVGAEESQEESLLPW